MATILSSKTFHVDCNGDLQIDEIKKWFDSIDRQKNNCVLTMTAKTKDNSRSKKRKSFETLSVLTSEANKKTYDKYGYFFYFPGNRFVWNNKDIYLTAGQALFLYRWLVLGEDVLAVEKYHLNHLRKKFGKDFLKEVTDDNS